MSTIDSSFEGWSFDENDVAAKSSAPPIVYIGSKRGADRGSKLEHVLCGLRLSFQRVEATDGIHLPDRLRWQFYIDGRPHPTLSPSEVCRYANHLLAMESVIENGWQYAVILEDEALVSPDIDEEISQIITGLPRNWDFLHLCQDPVRSTKTVAHTDSGISIIRYARYQGGTTGYLISRRGAEKILRPRKRYFSMAADLCQPWIFGLQVYGLSRRIVFNPNGPDPSMLETSAVSPAQERSAEHALGSLLRRFRPEVEA